MDTSLLFPIVGLFLVLSGLMTTVAVLSTPKTQSRSTKVTVPFHPEASPATRYPFKVNRSARTMEPVRRPMINSKQVERAGYHPALLGDNHVNRCRN